MMKEEGSESMRIHKGESFQGVQTGVGGNRGRIIGNIFVLLRSFKEVLERVGETFVKFAHLSLISIRLWFLFLLVLLSVLKEIHPSDTC